jgi:hypothetical protein
VFIYVHLILLDYIDKPSKILGWEGLVKVDGTVYQFLGDALGTSIPSSSGVLTAQQLSISYTATRSTFTLKAGPMDLIVEFLSPIEVNLYFY